MGHLFATSQSIQPQPLPILIHSESLDELDNTVVEGTHRIPPREIICRYNEQIQRMRQLDPGLAGVLHDERRRRIQECRRWREKENWRQHRERVKEEEVD